ncbi:S41 family peptidase [Stakelama saccharophila]|uniref:S41 family peptidase n=1 Tax=Stakelama saccharophila TaxID=3075605 RepID=A0ABZ0B9L5_9SPHN|nr:S41 family peptidase [Stakelama sp. W311]WNO53806.1 S41 family peptidase [Stakelama sp. W311]
MRMGKHLVAGLSGLALLAGCGGGGSGSVMAPPSGNTPSPSPTPAPTSGECSLAARQQWVLDQFREWYLFPDTLPDNPDPSRYDSVQAFIDALTATARAQDKDRYFSYLTSIEEENEYYEQGQTAGLGMRLSLDYTASFIAVLESFENGPALAAGIDRGTRITAIGPDSANLTTVASLYDQGGLDAVNDALGPPATGTSRAFRIADADGTNSRVVTVAKTEYAVDPVSDRYGARILADNGKRYGYLNLRTFISPAEADLRAAFARFRDAGIDEVIVDLRYNGGGLVYVSELLGNLLGGNRSGSDVYDYMTFRPEKADENTTTYFDPQPESIGATRIAFIGTQNTASASELAINAFRPYLGAADGLIGTNTYGKPVGQIALDKQQCDDRLRLIAFKLENADHQGEYYNGLAGTMESTCQAGDDLAHQMGDPDESSTRAALDFLEGKSCSPVTASGGVTTQGPDGAASPSGATMQSLRRGRKLLQPKTPTTPQRELPGLY